MVTLDSIRFTDHARDEMADDGITARQILDAINFGCRNSTVRSQHNVRQLGNVVVVYHTGTSDGELVVVTAWRLKTLCRRQKITKAGQRFHRCA